MVGEEGGVEKGVGGDHPGPLVSGEGEVLQDPAQLAGTQGDVSAHQLVQLVGVEGGDDLAKLALLVGGEGEGSKELQLDQLLGEHSRWHQAVLGAHDRRLEEVVQEGGGGFNQVVSLNGGEGEILLQQYLAWLLVQLPELGDGAAHQLVQLVGGEGGDDPAILALMGPNLILKF